MRIAFRADASTQIGSGHVMRCLTLAEELAGRGVEIIFISRDLPDDYRTMVEGKGFPVIELPKAVTDGGALDWNAHASWLGVDWEQDADETIVALLNHQSDVDWLIVDHYALDHRWEMCLQAHVGQHGKISLWIN